MTPTPAPVWPEPGAPDLLDRFRKVGAVDTTCFVGTWPHRPAASAGGRELSAYADRLGLSGLWVSHLASLFGFDTRTGNESLLEACAPDGRLRPFVVLNPAEAGWQRELEWARSVGAQGIRIAPSFHKYALALPAAGELRTAATELGLALHVLVRLDDKRVRHPRLPVVDPEVNELAEFLRPAGRGDNIVVSGLKKADWSELEGHLGGAGDGVLADLWFVNGPTMAVDDMGRRGLHERFCFGSAFPVQTPEATALQLSVADLRPDQRMAMLRGNADRLLPPRT